MPDLLLQARPYQREDIEKVVSWGGIGILGHKTGLGKTFIALGVWQKVGQPRAVLIVGTNSAMSVWVREVPRWTEHDVFHLTGSQNERNKILDKVESKLFAGQTVFVCCNFDIMRRQLAELTKIPFQMLIVDEAHKARNRKTVTWKALCVLRSKIRYFIAASATLASRGPQDLWGVLHLLDKHRFASYWRFVAHYCNIITTPFGKDIVGVRNAAQLKEMLRSSYYTSRTYEEVLPDLPPVTRQVVELSLDDVEQRRIYNALNKEMMAVIESAPVDDGQQAARLLLVPNVLSKITRLRQLLVCPPMLGIPTIGAGISYLKEAIEDDPHTVVFTPFASALPHIAAALKEVETVTGVWLLQGGMSPDEVNAAIDAFKQNKGVIICTIGFAQSFSLDTVHTAYFLGFSWDPTENIQAEGRLRRMDSKHTQGVVVKYLVHTDTIDEAVREVLNGKTMTVKQFMEDMTNERNRRSCGKVHAS